MGDTEEKDISSPKPGLRFGDVPEALCHTMPGIGLLPFKIDVSSHRHVVRLVSAISNTPLNIELQEGMNRIGRQRKNNHIVLVSHQISRFHAEISLHDDKVTLRDLGSANGTFVNGERITQRQLQAGDLIAFSNQFALRLVIDMPLSQPESTTFDPGPETPPPPPLRDIPTFERETIPPSLEARLKESSSAPNLTPPGPSVPPQRIGPVPVEIAPPRRVIPRDPRPRTPTLPRFPARPAERKRSSQAKRARLLDAAPSRDSSPSALDALKPSELERRQLAALYQTSKRFMRAESLPELDGLIVSVLERVVPFQQGFLTYQLPSGDWKLVIFPSGDSWERRHVRDMLHLALQSDHLMTTTNSQQDPRLGQALDKLPDARVLLPLRADDLAFGAVFLLSRRTPFDHQSTDFLSLFGDIAALAILHCARLESSKL